MAQTYFATINPGLEEALLEEVREIDGKRAKVLRGGVEFDATNTVFYRAAHQLRCANRLWLRIDEFRSRDAPELYNKTKRIDWARLIPTDVPVEVRASSRDSHLYHTEKVADAVRDGIDASLDRKRLTADDPLVVLARVVDDRCELSLDAVGDPLYQRGYKREAVAAPLRESVAAAMLRIIGWEPSGVVLDPFCGSGTIAIEAAQRAAGIPAGRDREFAFHRWKNFRPKLWEEVAATTAVRSDEIVAFASDLDPAAVEAARHNAERAGVASLCAFAVIDVAELEPPIDEPGWVVTNPPWNLRVEDPRHETIDALVKTVGERFADWSLAFVAPVSYSTNAAKPVTSFELGGVDVRLWKTNA